MSLGPRLFRKEQESKEISFCEYFQMKEIALGYRKTTRKSISPINPDRKKGIDIANTKDEPKNPALNTT
jgi:hypothetical protein